MARRIRISATLWLGAASALAVSLMLLASGSESVAHEGHDTEMWEFAWNRGTTERLLRYRFWHFNAYTRHACSLHDMFTLDCVEWGDTGETRTRPEDSCAASPEWVVAALDANRNQEEPSPPTGATCNRHDTYRDGEDQWVFSSHETRRIGVDRSTGPLHCRLPGTNIQSASTSTNTDPPGGESPVYRSSQAQPSRGSPARCGWGGGAGRVRLVGGSPPASARDSTYNYTTCDHSPSDDSGRWVVEREMFSLVHGWPFLLAGVADPFGRPGVELFVLGWAAEGDDGDQLPSEDRRNAVRGGNVLGDAQGPHVGRGRGRHAFLHVPGGG